MDVLIKDGDMVISASGNPVYIDSKQEIIQRILFALGTRKGGFRYDRNLGMEPFDENLDLRGLRKLEARMREAVLGIEGAEIYLISAERLSWGKMKALLRIVYRDEKWEEEVII